MKHRRTSTISLGLNLALAGVAVCLLEKTLSPRPSVTAPMISEPTTAPVAASLSAASNSPAPIRYVTNRFGWSQVQAEDFEQLATNLRPIGCPERTVREVVVARARRSLERISRSAGPKLPFWTAGLRKAHAQREAERDVAAARAKLFASVERAVGRDVLTEDETLMEKEDFVEQAIVRFVSGPMSEETFARLAVLLNRQEEQRDAIRASTHKVCLDEDEAALKALGRQSRQELAAVLLPAELEEFSARIAMLKLADQIRFEATDLCLAEIRTVALIWSQVHDPASIDWFQGDSLTEAQEAQFAKALRGFLGEPRYAQIERAGDGDFKKLFELGRAQNLPREAAVAVFDLRKLTAQEVERIRQDKSLSDADREQQLAQTQTHVQEGVLQVLGAEARSQYLNRGGAWVAKDCGALPASSPRTRCWPGIGD